MIIYFYDIHFLNIGFSFLLLFPQSLRHHRKLNKCISITPVNINLNKVVTSQRQEVLRLLVECWYLSTMW